MKELRIGFETFGCRSNHADTVDLQAGVTAAGAVPVSIESPADVYLVNTCAVTDGADRDALKLIRKLRRRAPEAKIIVTGCFAEIGEETIRSEVDVDAVIGPGRKSDVLRVLLEEQAEVTPRERGTARLPAWRSTDLLEPLPGALSGPGAFLGETKNRARFHLRIQEGCENACTFCIIPQTRGNLSSRPVELLLSDIERLSELGYEEVVLTGTHIGGYGEDSGSSLLKLLEAIQVASVGAARYPRIRLSSIDPNDLSKEMINLIAKGDVFCPHLHICVQALTDPLLKKMNRRYRLEEVVELLWYTRERLPRGAIGTDLITGFPGEGREDVEQGMKTFLDLPFSYLHVFPYSERSGTAATRLSGEVEPQERKRRAARWRAIGERRKNEFLRTLVGSPVEMIVESIDGETVSGTTREFATVRAKHLASAGVTFGVRRTVTPTAVDEQRGELVCD